MSLRTRKRCSSGRKSARGGAPSPPTAGGSKDRPRRRGGHPAKPSAAKDSCEARRGGDTSRDARETVAAESSAARLCLVGLGSAFGETQAGAHPAFTFHESHSPPSPHVSAAGAPNEIRPPAPAAPPAPPDTSCS